VTVLTGIRTCNVSIGKLLFKHATFLSERPGFETCTTVQSPEIDKLYGRNIHRFVGPTIT